MKRTEIKEKFDEILASFNPKSCESIYSLDEKEYNLIIDTVWQLSIGVDEADSIRTKDFKEKLKEKSGKDRFIAKVLDRLLKECGLKTYYKKYGV